MGFTSCSNGSRCSTHPTALQVAVAKILEAIYEQDFLPCSFGYRPKTGAHKAVEELSAVLRSREYTMVVEADIKGFFDNINHDLLLDMLKMRIDDKPLLKLIQKWHIGY